MKLTIQQSTRAWMVLCLGAVVVTGLGGCSEMFNPWVDDVPASEEVSTASVVGVRQTGEVSETRPRGFQPVIAAAHDGTVSHLPLYWEDPFVDRANEDELFAWSWEDYVAFPYGMGRSLLNTMAWPVSAVVTPPYTIMGSDGVLSRQALGYDHDAARLPGGLPPPIDVLEVGVVSPPLDGDEPPPAEQVPDTDAD
ncbi:MAG: hypothetical protein GY842_07210 [bacterium]|nr:hypothetical protein [bacterium]